MCEALLPLSRSTTVAPCPLDHCRPLTMQLKAGGLPQRQMGVDESSAALLPLPTHSPTQ
jgi:hypothetical protein